ncbi:MAG TPA: hypothetical protein VJ724_01625 [Tahibacter sp.]|nr:hypothetical protein [Tahibacter sp.]
MSFGFALKAASAILPLADVSSAGGDIDLHGTYSSLCHHEESGDLLGVELSFVYSAGKVTRCEAGRLKLNGTDSREQFSR